MASVQEHQLVPLVCRPVSCSTESAQTSSRLCAGTALEKCLLVLLAGNAWTDAGFDNQGAVDFWWTHALISDEVRDSLLQSCNFSGVGPLRESPLTAASLARHGKLEVSLGGQQDASLDAL